MPDTAYVATGQGRYCSQPWNNKTISCGRLTTGGNWWDAREKIKLHFLCVSPFFHFYFLYQNAAQTITPNSCFHVSVQRKGKGKKEQMDQSKAKMQWTENFTPELTLSNDHHSQVRWTGECSYFYGVLTHSDTPPNQVPMQRAHTNQAHEYAGNYICGSYILTLYYSKAYIQLLTGAA